MCYQKSYFYWYANIPGVQDHNTEILTVSVILDYHDFLDFDPPN